MNEAIFVLTLAKFNGIGGAKIRDYVASCRYDLNICRSESALSTIGVDYSQFLRQELYAKREIEDNNRKGIKITTLFDNNYPSKLINFKSPPIVYLYYIGCINLTNDKCVAVIGSRKTVLPDTNSATTKVVRRLCKKGVTIVSGLALGVDAEAHRACVECNGKAVAVMPCGLDKVEPSSNRQLAKEIIRTGGCLVSEYPVGTGVSAINYKRRDRVQAALSDAVITPEANIDGGTMIAVKHARNNGKSVYGRFIDGKNIVDNDLNDIGGVVDEIALSGHNDQMSLISTAES